MTPSPSLQHSRSRHSPQFKPTAGDLHRRATKYAILFAATILGDRKGIEEQTKTWDETVIDRREDLTNWVELFRKFVARNLKVFAYANNHYSLCRRRHNA